MIILYSDSLQTKLFLSNFIKNHHSKIHLAVELPLIPSKKNSSRFAKKPLLKKILKSSLTFLFFNFIIIRGYYLISYLFKTSFNDVLKSSGVKHLKVEYISSDLTSLIKKTNPDWIINASSIILKSDVLSLPKLGILNYHCAPLPEFRGPANYFWLLIEGVSVAFGTLHLVDHGLDTGDILAYGPKINVKKGTSVFELWYNLRLSSEKVLTNFLTEYNIDSFHPIKQNNNNATTRSFPKRKDVKKLKSRGYKIFTMTDIAVFLGACKKK